MVDSPLGPIKDRIKTDVRLPVKLSQRMDEVCALLGVNRNSFLTLAAARLCVDLSRMDPSAKKRRSLLREVRKLFNDIVDEVEKQS